jgi:glycosyltransferase involved in cell wall biosynthesis
VNVAQQRRVLLTVSGVIPEDARDQVARGVRPRLDYVEIADACAADLIDFDTALGETGRLGRLLERVAGRAPVLAWACFRRRRRYDVILTDGEQVGLPLAALLRLRGVFPRGSRRPRHAMVVHILSVRKKVLLYKALRLGGAIDRMFVYSSRQRDFIAGELDFPAASIVLTTFMVDTDFWRAPHDAAPGIASHDDAPPVICSAGLEHRDYPTLIEAVRGLDVRCVIAAGSRWSKRTDSSRGVELPPNVKVCNLDYVALRELYASSSFVVIPLYDVEFQAGVTSILEAMSMSRPVVCTRSTGQTDVIVDGETGVYVPPGDVVALRGAIEGLLADPDRTADMGGRARRDVVATADVGDYATRVAAVVAEL